MLGFLPYLALSTFINFDFHFLERKPDDLIYMPSSLNIIQNFVKTLPSKVQS
jgi:hypothetical protein